jgi:membrane-associated phospholipid phosphatase
MSSILSAQLVTALKHDTHQLRPDGSTYNSFPSGHTTTAFIGAEMMNQEYGWRSPWYSVAGYAMASGTAALRVMNNRHWLSDVLAGAGIGMLTTKCSYWLYGKWENRKHGKQIVYY